MEGAAAGAGAGGYDAEAARAALLGPPAAVPDPREDSGRRVVFDLAFGAVIPVVLLHLDLHMLPGVLMDIGGLLPFRPYPPVGALAAIALLLAWYPLRRRPGWGHALVAGPFAAAALFAGITAILLLPLSLFGALHLGIGLLGLLPFGTAVVFRNNARRAWREARRTLAFGPALALALCAAGLFGGACLAAGRAARIVEIRATEVILGRRAGNPDRAEFALEVMHRVPIVDLRLLHRGALTQLRDGSRDGLFGELNPGAEAWERLTGRSFLESFD